MDIQKMINELDQESNRIYEEYVLLHRELDHHRGKQIDDTNLPEVNRLLKEIQEKFAEVYPAYYWVAQRNQFAVNAVNSYNDFIELLKKAGAHKDGEQVSA